MVLRDAGSGSRGDALVPYWNQCRLITSRLSEETGPGAGGHHHLLRLYEIEVGLHLHRLAIADGTGATVDVKEPLT